MFGCCNVNCNDKSTCFAVECFDEFGCFRTDVPVIMLSCCFNVVLLFYQCPQAKRDSSSTKPQCSYSYQRKRGTCKKLCYIRERERARDERQDRGKKGKIGGRK